jgi:hypothetical protein
MVINGFFNNLVVFGLILVLSSVASLMMDPDGVG